MTSKRNRTAYLRQYRRDREASGDHRVTVWLPQRTHDAVEARKVADGLTNKGEAIAAAFDELAALKRKQQQEERSATRRRA